MAMSSVKGMADGGPDPPRRGLFPAILDLAVMAIPDPGRWPAGHPDPKKH